MLADIGTRNIDEIVVAGDLVGRGPLGNAVVKRISALGLKTLRGNHEDYMLAFRNREVPEEWLTIEEWACARWMANELDDDAYAFIKSTPFTLSPETAPSICVVHGSPRSNNEGIGPWTPEETMREHLALVDASVLVCAHTHRPGIWEFDGRMIVNVGSVGLPFNKDPRAQYAVFEGSGRTWKAELLAVEYDRGLLLDAYQSTGFLAAGGATANLLRREVEDATPYLVPFLKWAEVLNRRPLNKEIEAFLDFHDPSLSLKDQYERLMALAD